MEEDQFYVLADQYVTDTISKDGRETFAKMLALPFYQDLFEKRMREEWEQGTYEEGKNEEIGRLIEQGVMQKISRAKVVSMNKGSIRWIRRAAAVAILTGLLAGGYYLLVGNGSKKKNEIFAETKHSDEIRPGSNRAILQLENGQQIVLDSLASGTVAHEGGAKINKEATALLSYEVENSGGKTAINTVTTPKGGQYHIRLSDGTEVWLNAAASIRFPAVFTGTDRTIELTGEAYFEVAHDPAKPFRVKVGGTQVEVLGTHFDVNAYEDEGAWKATLVEGKIKVTKGLSAATLSPGQQVQISSVNELKVIKSADVEEALAWKKGFFQFNNAEITTVMKQISRWYDVEVLYEGARPAEHFTGTISRTIPASDLLHLLNVSGIHCKIAGGKIIVKP